MKWHGLEAFLAELERIANDLEMHCAVGNRRTAQFMQSTALANMDAFGIRRITGISRDHYQVEQGPTNANAAVSNVVARVGYLSWPESLVFYPRFLNDGTSRMMARPYHTTAFEAAGPVHQAEMADALNKALNGASVRPVSLLPADD